VRVFDRSFVIKGDASPQSLHRLYEEKRVSDHDKKKKKKNGNQQEIAEQAKVAIDVAATMTTMMLVMQDDLPTDLIRGATMVQNVRKYNEIQ